MPPFHDDQSASALPNRAGVSNSGITAGDHFETADQRYSAVKMGMWLFLATEILLFGGLFVLYVIFRIQEPTAFQYGSAKLDVGWGLINTSLLIFSSFTVAMAVYCAKKKMIEQYCVFMILTIMCGLTFLGVKVIEYEHKFHDRLLWGAAYSPRYATAPVPETIDAIVVDEGVPADVDITRGRRFYRMICMSCHGSQGEGVVEGGLPLVGNPFVDERSDNELVQFIRQGRPANALDNILGIEMPARAENIGLTERDLQAIVQYIRSLDPVTSVEEFLAETRGDQGSPIHKTSLTEAEQGPPGILKEFLFADLGIQWDNPSEINSTISMETVSNQPDRSYIFFGLYFVLTGVHGLHLIAGLIVLTWLLLMALGWSSHFEFSSSVELGGMYWHLVDLIWIFLFPLLYLIH